MKTWGDETNPKRSNVKTKEVGERVECEREKEGILRAGAPNDNFRKNISSEDDLRARIFETFVVKFLACLPLLGFSNIQKMVYLPIFNGFLP